MLMSFTEPAQTQTQAAEQRQRCALNIQIGANDQIPF